MTTSTRISPRLLLALKRGLITSVILGFLIYFFPTHKVRSLWDYDGGARLQGQYSEGLDVSLTYSEWGLRGKQVKQLGEWATALTENPSLDNGELMNAIAARFPWLAGADHSLYKPWSSEGAAADKGKASRQTGMVVCSGSSNYHLAAHLIVSLRRVHKSTIPIQIAYAGDNDLSHEHRQYLQNLEADITFLNLLDIFPNAHDDLVGSGWAMKPFALLASRYPRTMLVDADALFLAPPDNIFETDPDLARTGTLFHHDRAAIGGGDEGLVFLKAQIAAAGLEPSSYLKNESLYFSGDSWYEADAGFVCLDKSKPQVWMGLVFATWMNTKEVREEISYKWFYGDKETFWMAMELSSVDYYFQPWYAGSMGTISDQDPTELCSTHMLHMSRDGKSPFWLNGGIYQHKSIPSNGYARLTHYWTGNPDAATKASWYWTDGNVACFKEKTVKAVDDAMMKIIGDMIQEATKVDRDLHST
jgi:alpha 1,3-mannosyltransferase